MKNFSPPLLAPFRLTVLLLCLCAVTALTLLTGLPTSSAQAADFYIIGDLSGGGGVNADIHTGG